MQCVSLENKRQEEEKAEVTCSGSARVALACIGLGILDDGVTLKRNERKRDVKLLNRDVATNFRVCRLSMHYPKCGVHGNAQDYKHCPVVLQERDPTVDAVKCRRRKTDCVTHFWEIFAAAPIMHFALVAAGCKASCC